MITIQLVLNALALGMAYALVALGFVLALNASGAVNFAQGDLVVLGGAVAVLLASWLGLPGFGNAYLLTGDDRYLDPWRKMIDLINAQGKMVAGKTMYPHMFGDQGWYDFTEERYKHGAQEIWYWSMRADGGEFAPNEEADQLDWLSPADAAAARALRLQNAAKGMREPVQVMDGNYRVMPGVCAWWDGVQREQAR